MIPSPCIGVCRIDPSHDLCVGCARTRDEIAIWQTASDAQKASIWSLLPERRGRMKQSLHRLNWSVDQLHSFVMKTLAPAGGTWVSGVNGAIAEFCVGADDHVEFDSRQDRITARTRGGAIRLALSDHVAALAIGTSDDSDDRGRVILLAVPRGRASPFPGDGLARLGADADAIDPGGRDAILYDFGLGRCAGAFCVRTSSSKLTEGLDDCLGVPWSQVLHLRGADILAESPARVVRNPIGRIEVYNRIPPPDGDSPTGPHTHFLPGHILKGGDVPAALEIPEAYVPCAVYYPPVHIHSHAVHEDAAKVCAR
jgi:predicted Fe-S protein YdhL (DUF1289 family)